MTRGLEAASARARGLSARLIPPASMRALAESATLEQLAHALEPSLPGPRPEAVTSAAHIEAWARAAAGNQMSTLARWLQLRPGAAELLFADEEQRAVRRIVRGIVTGQPPGWRLQDLIPTPALPNRALSTLAEQSTLGEVAATLTAWRSPYADAVAALTQQTRPDAFQIDLALLRACVDWELRVAQRAGSEFRQHVRNVIDSENLLAALVVAERPEDVAVDDVFVEGGENLARAVFVAAARSPGGYAALNALRRGVRGWLVPALRAGDWSVPELTLLRAWIRHYRRLALLEPVDLRQPALFLLRLRAQLCDLRRIAWSIALRAPPSVLRERLVDA